MAKIETVGQRNTDSRPRRWNENSRQARLEPHQKLPSAEEVVERLRGTIFESTPQLEKVGSPDDFFLHSRASSYGEIERPQNEAVIAWKPGIIPPAPEEISWANSQSNNGSGRREKNRLIVPTITSTVVLFTIASCVNIEEPTAIVEPVPTREELPTVIEIQLPTPIPSEVLGQQTPEVIPTLSFTENLEGLEATGGPYTPEQLLEAQSVFEDHHQSALRVRDELIASRAIAGNANLGLNPVLKIENDKVVDANWEWRILEGEVEFNGDSYEEGTAVIASYVENHEGEPLWLSPDGASDVLVGAEVNRVGIDKDTGLATAWNNSGTVGYVDKQTGQWTQIEELAPEPTEESTPTPTLEPTQEPEPTEEPTPEPTEAPTFDTEKIGQNMPDMWTFNENNQPVVLDNSSLTFEWKSSKTLMIKDAEGKVVGKIDAYNLDYNMRENNWDEMDWLSRTDSYQGRYLKSVELWAEMGDFTIRPSGTDEVFFRFTEESEFWQHPPDSWGADLDNPNPDYMPWFNFAKPLDDVERSVTSGAELVEMAGIRAAALLWNHEHPDQTLEPADIRQKLESGEEFKVSVGDNEWNVSEGMEITYIEAIDTQHRGFYTKLDVDELGKLVIRFSRPGEYLKETFFGNDFARAFFHHFGQKPDLNVEDYPALALDGMFNYILRADNRTHGVAVSIAHR